MAEENGPQTNADGIDLSLTAIIKALDSENPMPDARDSGTQAAFDPNATMNYQQAGASYPELPFANEDSAIPAAKRPQQEAAHQAHQAHQAPQAPQAHQPMNSRLDELSGTRRAETPRTTVPRTSTRSSERTRSRSSAAAGTKVHAARAPFGSAGFESAPSNYRPLRAKQSTYKIRGGGHAQKLDYRSPVFIAISVLLVAIGIGIFAFAFNSLTSSASSGSSGYEFDLTTTQTREAIDSRVPILVNYVDAGIEDTIASIAASGQFTYANEQYQPDSPDTEAGGSEMVGMPQEMTAEQMAEYYAGGYNAFLPEELTEYFNGAYALDMARGELGSWNKIKYVNLNATSIADEMTHLADLQQLSGDSVTISAEGVDSRGNYVIQGQKVIEGERILYFKIAACPFSDIYNAQTLSDASVYATCTVATYDFFTGSDTITPESE